MTNESERAAFEEWALHEGLNIHIHPASEHYQQSPTYYAWKAWQARAQLIAEQEKAEAVGHFIETEKGYWEQVAVEYIGTSDTQPLYLHPAPSADRVASCDPEGERHCANCYSGQGECLMVTKEADRVAAQGGAVSQLVRTAPEVIYLQVSDDANHVSETFPDYHEEITWSQNSVLDCEVKYVRADLALHATPADGDKLAKAIGDGV